jgi:hypothetical protein
MIRAGKTLVCWFGDRITVGPSPEGGFVVSGYDAGAVVQRKRFDDSRRAIRFFRAAAKRDGLLQAVSSQRYAFLFPTGSSLDWRVAPTRTDAPLARIRRSA